MPKWDSFGRVCTVCSEYKPWDQFSRKTTKRYKEAGKLHQVRQPKCKACAIEETKNWKNNKSEDELKDMYLQRTYSVSLNWYNRQIEKQQNTCLICNTIFSKEPLTGKSPVVDHDHDTGKVRGIICNECNRGIGYFRDSTTALENAAKYLKGELSFHS